MSLLLPVDLTGMPSINTMLSLHNALPSPMNNEKPECHYLYDSVLLSLFAILNSLVPGNTSHSRQTWYPLPVSLLLSGCHLLK